MIALRTSISIFLLVFLSPSSLHAQKTFENMKEEIGNSYDDWSQKQDWKHNYFEWKKTSDQEYNDWMTQSGFNDEDLGAFDLGIANNLNSPSRPIDLIDSLQAQIEKLQHSNQTLGHQQLTQINLLEQKVNELTGQNQTLNQQLEHNESLGDFKIWAVIVGVSRYNKEQARLNYCDDDAYKIYAFLKSPEGGALPDEQIRLFIDEDAKGANVSGAIAELTQKAGPDDVFFFYFSGHGTVSNLLANDYDSSPSGQISHAFLSKEIQKCPAKLSLCVIDACHSGSIALRVDHLNAMQKNAYEVIEQGQEIPGYRSVASLESTTNFYEALQSAEKGSVYILSSKGEEYSLEVSGKRQGVFSFYFIKGLQGGADYNNDNIISVTESFDYTRKQVIAHTKHAQTPIITGNYTHTLPLAAVRRKD